MLSGDFDVKLAADRLQFVEYDQRAHRLSTLLTFSFWVQSRKT